MNDTVLCEVELWHDVYETTMGDGYYPTATVSSGLESSVVLFVLENYNWRQYPDSAYAITTLTHASYNTILATLNKKADVNAVRILNKYGSSIRTF